MDDDALWPTALNKNEREALRTAAKYLFDEEGFGLTYKQVADPIGKRNTTANVTEHSLRNFVSGGVEIPNQKAFLIPLLKYVVEDFRISTECPENVREAYLSLMKLRNFPYSIAMRVLLGKRNHTDYPQPIKDKYIGGYFSYRWTRSKEDEEKFVAKSYIKINGFDSSLKVDTFSAMYRSRKSGIRKSFGHIIKIAGKLYFIGYELEDVSVDLFVLNEVRGSANDGSVPSMDGLVISTSSAGGPIAARMHLVRKPDDRIPTETEIGVFPLSEVMDEIQDVEKRIDNDDLSEGGVLDTYLA